jgi:hypothetical protein
MTEVGGFEGSVIEVFATRGPAKPLIEVTSDNAVRRENFFTRSS